MNLPKDLAARLARLIFLGLLAYMPLHIFLSTWLGTSFGALEFAKIAKDILLIVGFGLVLWASVRTLWFKELLQDRLVWLIAAYGLLTVLLAIVKPTDSDAEILGLVYNTRFLIFFVYALLLSRLYDVTSILRPAFKIVLSVGALVVLFGVVQYTLLPDSALSQVGYSRADGVLPAFFIDDKPDLERVMSTLRDPNSLGSYLIIIGMLSATLIGHMKTQKQKYMALGLLAATLLCLWFSFSRSAWLGFVLAAVSFVALSNSKYKQTLIKYRKAVILASVISLIVIGLIIGVARNSYFVQNVIFHADSSTTLEDPNELRIKFIKESASGIVADPAGSGPGTAGLASIRNEKQGTELNENYYLQIASEVGLIGLGLFLAILIMVGKRLYGLRQNVWATSLLAAFIGLAFTNLLVHIWSNEAVSYTWWGLAGLIAASATQQFKTSKASSAK